MTYRFTPQSPVTSDKPVAPPPTLCPACGSPAIATAAKKPDEESYWRCRTCGDVWNPLRRARGRFGRAV